MNLYYLGDRNLNEEDIESDIEYDLSEEDESDDNFIDDSEYTADVSKHIRRITGYDRRMYVYCFVYNYVYVFLCL